MQNKNLQKACEEAILDLALGNREALSSLYDYIARLILSVAYTITSNYQDAEDVLQDTLIEVTKYASSYKKGTNARAWILAITRHKAIDILRKRKAFVSIEDVNETDLPHSICTEFSQLEVLDLLRVLSEEERQLVILRLYSELPYHNISNIMGCSVMAAQKKYQRAIKKLKQHNV